MAKGKKKHARKKKEEVPVEEVVEEFVVPNYEEEEPKEVTEFTDTSYTSASFETIELEPVVSEVKEKKRRRKKKIIEVEELSIKDEEEFDWSEESLPVIEEEKRVEPEPSVVKKSKKKKKKDKKPVEDIPDFDKPKGWKKMNLKVRAAWLEERIQQWKEEMEAEKQAKLAGAKAKRIAVQKERDDIMAQAIEEHEVRKDKLFKTCLLFTKYANQKAEFENKRIDEAEWQQYLRCDGLPDPRIVSEMSTYLHKWQLNEEFDVDELGRRC